jgi:hypothetical protein
VSVPLLLHAAREQPTLTIVALCLKRFDIPGLESMTEPSRNLIRDSVVHMRYQPSISGALTPSDTSWRLCIAVKWSVLWRRFVFCFLFFLPMYVLGSLVWFSSEFTILESLNHLCGSCGPCPFPIWPVEPLVPWDSNERQPFTSL